MTNDDRNYASNTRLPRISEEERHRVLTAIFRQPMSDWRTFVYMLGLEIEAREMPAGAGLNEDLTA